MASISKNIMNNGTEETVIISSDDFEKVNVEGKMVLANSKRKQQSNFEKKFKSSILGSEIGIKNGGFTSITILATVIALTTAAVLFFMWRY